MYADFKLSQQRTFFSSPLGLAPGVCREDGNAVENLLEMGELGFVELGPVTIDPQHQPSLRTKLITIGKERIDHKYIDSRYSCNQIVYKLLERQENIRDRINKGEIINPPSGKIGVCIEASHDTIDSVPYLTH